MFRDALIALSALGISLAVAAVVIATGVVSVPAAYAAVAVMVSSGLITLIMKVLK